MEHAGAAPQFVMRAVSYHKTALSRQIAEAVRIRRRGGQGAILNSKAEYNRCHIPRLQLEEEEQEGARERMEQELLELAEEEQMESIDVWERLRSQDKAKEQRQNARVSKGAKHRIVGGEGSKLPKRKKLEHPIIGEEWGSKEPGEEPAK